MLALAVVLVEEENGEEDGEDSAAAAAASFTGPPTLPAPRNLPLMGATRAAESRSVDVGGVRSSKWKDRSGRTVTRAGMGVPGL